MDTPPIATIIIACPPNEKGVGPSPGEGRGRGEVLCFSVFSAVFKGERRAGKGKADRIRKNEKKGGKPRREIRRPFRESAWKKSGKLFSEFAL